MIAHALLSAPRCAASPRLSRAAAAPRSPAFALARRPTLHRDLCLQRVRVAGDDDAEFAFATAPLGDTAARDVADAPPPPPRDDPAITSTSASATTSTIPEPDARFKGLKVVVAGATGGVGRAVVNALLARGVPVRALVRDAARAAKLLPAPSPTLEIVVGDVTQYASLPPALGGGDYNALIICTGARDFTDPAAPFSVDYAGTANLVAAAKNNSGSAFKRVVLVTSIGADDLINPLNLFWGVLFWKKRGEEALQRSGLPYTIIRPGGLKTKLAPGETNAGSIVAKPPGTYGVPPLRKAGSILRSQVAEVCVDALVTPAAEGKVLEVIAERGAPARSLEQLLG